MSGWLSDKAEARALFEEVKQDIEAYPWGEGKCWVTVVRLVTVNHLDEFLVVVGGYGYSFFNFKSLPPDAPHPNFMDRRDGLMTACFEDSVWTKPGADITPYELVLEWVP